MKNLQEIKKKFQPVDLLLGIFIGILLTVIFFQYIKPNLRSASKSDNQAVQTLKTSIDDSAYIGDKNKAKVAIVEFSDFECPYCQKFYEDSFGQIKEQYINKNKAIFVYRNFPLPFHNPVAEKEANTALCVRNQKDNQAFFDMTDLIYKNTGLNGKGIADDKLISLALQFNINESEFKDCFNSDRFKDQIQKETDAGTAAGVSGTPSFVIGKLKSNGDVEGELVEGALPFSDIQKVIEKYL